MLISFKYIKNKIDIIFNYNLYYIKKMPTRKVSNLTKKKVASCQEWKCKYCNSLLDECFEIDHIICIKDGGSNE